MNQSELTSHVSELCVRLGDMRRQESGNRPIEAVIAPYAAAIFLLRRAESMDSEQEAAAASDGRDYLPALPRDRHWSSWRHVRDEELVYILREEVLPALRNSPNRIIGQFLRRVVSVAEALASESPDAIEVLVNWAKAFDVETVTGKQAAGDALRMLVEKTTAKDKTLGAHTAPQPVVELMADLLDPDPGERIYDPCFGAGGLLATVTSRLRETAMEIPPKARSEAPRQSVFGVEIDPFAYCIGLARVVLAGMDQPGLELGDALERPLAGDRSCEGFDCILAVPPWGARARPEVASEFQVSTTNLETLFLQHVMASLRPGGRAVVALPEGVLFRSDPDRSVRKKLLSDYRVEGVISLPEGALRPYTGIKMSLVLFRRKEATQTVRFMQIEDWPSIRTGDGNGRAANVEVARTITAEFRNGTPDDVLWKHPIKDLWEIPTKEFADRSWELIAKRTGEKALSRSLRVLEEDAGVPVRPLNKVAEIFAGVSYGKAVTTTRRDDPSVFAGLVRTTDLNRSGVQSPSIFLTKDGSKRVQSKHRLRAGDVLLTTSGAIGALAVVSEKAGIVDAVAAGSVTVIRPGKLISPMFLKSVLASDAYQEWIRGHARGATIQDLPARTLRNLRVPAPQVSVQEQLLKQMVDEREDPFAALVRVLTSHSEDPVVSWLNGYPELRKLRRRVRPVDRVALLERIAHSAWSLRDQVVHSRIHDKSLIDEWLKDLAEALKTLQGLNHVPPGSGRMVLLDGAQNRIEDVYSSIRGLGDPYLMGWKHGIGIHSGLPFKETLLPAFTYAIDFTKRISRLVRAELDLILDDVTLEPRIEPGAVVAGTENEVQVRLKNLSPLALRNLSISTSPVVGSTRLGYLAEGTSHSFTAKIPAFGETGQFPFKLIWQAERLDGQSISGELPLAVDVHSTPDAIHVADLGASPYIVGNPVDREEMFYGRQSIIDQIRRQLSTSHQANVILLEGNRRIGKTSILRHLQVPDVLPGWIVVNCSLQGGEGHQSETGLTTNELFRHMARDIAWAMDEAGLQVWLPDLEPPDTSRHFKFAFGKASSKAFSGSRPFEVFELYMQSVLEAASPRRLLLMLDEFDKLPEGIDSGVTSPQVPENIRYLLHTYQGLSAILCGSRQLKRLREQYQSALFGIGYRVTVSEIPMEDARLLITRPVDGRLTYVPDATNLAIDLCARHPFLIQSLCARIFEWAARTNERTVTIGAVETAVQEMVRDNEHFDTLWNYAQTERRRFLLALCRKLKGGPDPITLSLLETKVEEYGIAVPHGDSLGEDLESLRELELLELHETMVGSTYRFAVPLMEDWIGRNLDFEHQRQKAVRESEELDVAGGYGGGEGDGRGLPDGSGFGAGSGQGYGSRGTEGEQ